MSILAAATPHSFCWNEPGALEDRALELARSMAAVKCKNKYPTGVIGAEARAHYVEARSIAQAIEARQRQDRGTGLGPKGESAVANGDAPTPDRSTQSDGSNQHD